MTGSVFDLHRKGRRADPLIDEIRAIRREIVERCDNDLDKLCDLMQDLEREHPDRVLHPRDARAGESRSVR